MQKIGFQRKLSLILVLMSLAGMIVCGGVSYYFIYQLLQKQIFTSLDSRISNVDSIFKISVNSAVERQNEMMDLWGPKALKRISIDTRQSAEYEIENQVTHLKTKVRLNPFLIDGNTMQTHQFVDDISAVSGNAVTLMALTSEGLVRVSTSLKKTNGERAIFTYVPNGSPVVESIVSGKRYSGLAQVLGKIYITSYEPIVANGKVVGAIFLGSPEVAIDKIKEHLRKEKILDTGYFYILDSRGNFVLHPTKEGENVLETSDLNGRPIFKDILNMKNGVIEYKWQNAETQLPQDKIAVFHTLPNLDWTVAASLNSAEAFSSLTKLKITMLSIIGGLIVLMIALSLLIGMPMARQLLEIEKSISKSVEDCSAISESVNSVSQTLASAATQQAGALQETASALEEVRTTVQTNLASTQNASSAGRHLTEISGQTAQTLQSLGGAIQDINSENNRFSENVTKSYDEIGKILDLISEIEQKTNIINEIVFQTKLLSFNASVEAARAGESGRGFAVVAEEIGRLANISGKSAEEIRGTLEQNRDSVTQIIQSAKSEVDLLLKSSSEKISAGVDLTSECQEQFQKMSGDVNSLTQLIERVAVASEEQAKAIDEISKAMLEVDVLTQKNAALAQEANHFGVDLKTNAVKMDEASSELKKFIKGQIETS